MTERTINISVYGKKGFGSLNNALEGLITEGYKLSLYYPDGSDFLFNDIIIVNGLLLDSHLVGLLSEFDLNKNKIIFIIPENDSLFLSALAKKGFVNFFIFPYEYYLFIDYIKELIENINLEPDNIENASIEKDSFSNILGDSKEIRKIIEISKKIADKENINILITGETGTGKGLLARAIHDYNNPAQHPFVEITCTSIPETLLESELFGFEAGAFTNAKYQKLGLFEVAENGTLFLDEIGDISMNIQSKLLRTLDKKIIRRVGGIVDIPINARIISATNINIEENVANNTFRKDLFHRLNTVSIEIPPLRERGRDVELLAEIFIKHFSLIHNKTIKKIESSFKDYIKEYQWPGNVRELRNFIERNVLLCENKILSLEHVSTSYTTPVASTSSKKDDPSLIHLNLDSLHTDLKSIEKLYAKVTLNKLNGNKSKAAKALGISRPKLDDLLNN